MKKRERAAAAAMATVAAAGMVTGAVFDAPADLLEDTDAITESVDEQEAARKLSPAARIRRFVLSLPEAVRILVGIPLWCLGWVLESAFAALTAASTPLVQQLVGWLCLALVLLAAHTIAVKAAFPKVSLRRILRPGTVLFLLGMSAVLALADLALPSVWTGYDRISQAVWRIGSFCLLCCTCGAALKRHGRRGEKQLVPAAKHTAVEQEARRLADTVCPPR